MQTYPTGYAESHRIAEQIFREILPRHGMAVREEQIALCHEVLDTLYNKEISLCEAGVGIGKTLAYLSARAKSALSAMPALRNVKQKPFPKVRGRKAACAWPRMFST